MAITNHERIGKALDLLKDGLRPFIEREMKAQYQQAWFEEFRQTLPPQQMSFFPDEAGARWDAAAVLSAIWSRWNEVFRKTLGQAERTLVSELREARNNWVHQSPFSTDDAYRILEYSSDLDKASAEINQELLKKPTESSPIQPPAQEEVPSGQQEQDTLLSVFLALCVAVLGFVVIWRLIGGIRK